MGAPPAPDEPPPAAAALVEAALDEYARLSAKGKPQAHEHTVLAAVVCRLRGSSADSADALALRTLALATGTKCLGASRRAADGGAVNDCHAEALARRALVWWLCREAERAARGESEVLEVVRAQAAEGEGRDEELGAEPDRPSLLLGTRLRLRARASLHLVVTAPPCGDACVGSGAPGGPEAGVAPRTGAKPLAPGSEFLPRAGDVESYAEAQAAGALRRKPGKGDPTLSMSCSDKLVRWTLLGLQGCLMSALFSQPLRLASVAVACGGASEAACRDVQAALHRAVRERALRWTRGRAGEDGDAFSLPECVAVPTSLERLRELGLARRRGQRSAPGGSCLVWARGQRPGYAALHEALTAAWGIRMGHAGVKRNAEEAVRTPPSARSQLCKARMAARWWEAARLLAALDDARAKDAPESSCGSRARLERLAALSYGDLKRCVGREYARTWRAALEGAEELSAWIAKPAELEAFALGE